LGEWLTFGAIWVALLCYFGVATGLVLGRGERSGRWGWTIGWLSYVVHVGCAFHFYHDWSHAQAYEDTARQTRELFGMDWGGGLYVNYLFTLAWAMDVAWWWWCGERRVNVWVERSWQGFFFFMVVNATVVFGSGWSRWTGVVGCAVLVGGYVFRRGRNRAGPP